MSKTLDWHVMQDPKDETKFCIVERYEQESSQQYHLNNPVCPFKISRI
jgi:quinol monooxygenase YgiN